MKFFNKTKASVQTKKLGEWKATLWYTAASLFTKAFGFLTIPLYTNLLTTGEYGYLNTYNAWISICSVIVGLSLNNAVISIQKEQKEIQNPYQSCVLALSLVSFLGISIIIFLGSIWIMGEVSGILVLALIQSYAVFVMNFLLQEMVLSNQYIKYSLLSVVSGVIPVLITCAIIPYFFQSQRYLSVIVPKAVIAVGIMGIGMAFIFGRGKMFYNKAYWKQSLSYCIPIIFHTLALSLMLQADRIMLSYFKGYEESGIYSFIYNITLVIGVVVAALENTWKTWFFQTDFREHASLPMQEDPLLVSYQINARAKVYLVCGEAGILAFVYVAPEVIRLLANEAYWDSAYLTAPIAFSYIISLFYDFLVYYEYRENATKRIASASLAAAILNILLNGIAIPLWGAMGAAAATIASRLVQFGLHLKTVHRLEQTVLPFRLYLPFFIRSAFMMAVFLVFYTMPVVRFSILGIYLLTRIKGIGEFFKL